jgi:hypothetical protein
MNITPAARRSWLGAFLLATVVAGCNVEQEGEEAPAVDREAKRDLYVLNNALWGHSIAVCWESSGNSTEKGWVQNALEQTWSFLGDVTFTGWNTCPAYSLWNQFDGLRIRISDEGPHTEGLGTNIRAVLGGMTLNFTFNNWSTSCQSSLEYCIRTIAVHEFGHVLAFAHEQNRPDTPVATPAACATNADCASSENCSGGVCRQGTNGNETYGAWDLNSVMNYQNPVWNNRGLVSATDRDGLQHFYGVGKPLVAFLSTNGIGLVL